MASLIAGSAFGLGLLASGLGVIKGKAMGFVMAPTLTVLLAAYFGYRFTQSAEVFPSGLMTTAGLVALVLYFALGR